MHSPYKNIIFDLGNVIIDIDYQATYQALAPLFSTEADLPELKHKVDELTHRYEQGFISTELFINKLLKDMRPEAHARKVIDAWNAMLLDIPAARLEHLKQLGKQYRLIFLSNTNPLHIEWVDRFLMERHRIDNFKAISADVFYSHELQDRKPNASIFQKILDKLKVKAAESLFFDDNIENIETALAVGIHGVHSPAEIEIIEQTQGLLE